MVPSCCGSGGTCGSQTIQRSRGPRAGADHCPLRVGRSPRPHSRTTTPPVLNADAASVGRPVAGCGRSAHGPGWPAGARRSRSREGGPGASSAHHCRLRARREWAGPTRSGKARRGATDSHRLAVRRHSWRDRETRWPPLRSVHSLLPIVARTRVGLPVPLDFAFIAWRPLDGLPIAADPGPERIWPEPGEPAARLAWELFRTTRLATTRPLAITPRST